MVGLDRRVRVALFAIFAATGFAALSLQVIWQRIMSLHSGVDLVSFTTVIAAFLAGLGIGSLIGGALADRLGPRRSLVAFALANAGIAVYAFASIWMFYDLYRDLARDLGGTASTFGFNFALVVVPATLMGLSLPLVAKGIVERAQDAGPLVGRLYAINTLGAAFGAAVTGWFLAGTFGFANTLRIAGAINLLAAVLVLSLWRLASRLPTDALAPDAPSPDAPSPDAPSPDDVAGAASPLAHRRIWPWYAVYFVTGAVALGYELVFFRIIDSIMRSNSYSFPHVLTLYLLFFGIGSAVGSRFVSRATRPARWFLGLQSAAGLAALSGLLVLTVVLPAVGFDDTLRSYFGGDGFNTGFSGIDSPTEYAKLAFAYVAAPLLVMALPVFLFGASFPFVQALVSERQETLGRRTGTLIAANIAGNVAGTLLVGFVLLDQLGTAATTLLLGGVLVAPGIVAALLDQDRRRRVVLVGAVVASFALVAGLFPSNAELWSLVHGVEPGPAFELVEDRSCVTTLKQGDLQEDYESYLFVNASGQNGYPWDDFHVLVGLTPALMHPDPQRGLAVGLGMGGTAYGMVQDPRLGTVDTVELCGGQIELLRRMAAEGTPEHQRMFADDRLRLRVGDGRKYLLLTDPDLDVVTVDVLRPQSAFSGSILSVEFYELIRSRLAGNGLLAQWIASPRSGNSVARAFPYAIGFTVPSYRGSQFFVASTSPITFDRTEVLHRLDALGEGSFRPEQLASLRTFYEQVEPFCLADGAPSGSLEGDLVNRDLAPRDEYFLNNPDPAGRVPC